MCFDRWNIESDPEGYTSSYMEMKLHEKAAPFLKSICFPLGNVSSTVNGRRSLTPRGAVLVDFLLPGRKHQERKALRLTLLSALRFHCSISPKVPSSFQLLSLCHCCSPCLECYFSKWSGMGSPSPWLQTSRNWAAQQEMSGRKWAKLHLLLPIAHITSWIAAPPICGKVVFHGTGPWCQKGWGPLV